VKTYKPFGQGLKRNTYASQSPTLYCSMTEYTITIDGYESGLTAKTVEQQFREQFGGQDVHISVREKE